MKAFRIASHAGHNLSTFGHFCKVTKKGWKSGGQPGGADGRRRLAAGADFTQGAENCSITPVNYI